ncbi:MAG: SPOR domain-containing protein [Candidatus Thiodiazotropha sp. (ex Epidulcina cf. delphinae)]|nr:SPOR domain-containing protein [Candidatus Thiodiazotropha sp. (ex Epidulcina cf. delphinae)]
MADYKHRAGGKKKKPQNHSSCGIYFFGGLIAGIFLTGLLWLKLGADLSNAQVPGVTKAQPKPTPSENPPAPKPTFEFYTILPEMEVVIPDEEIVTPERQVSAKTREEPPPTSVREQNDYILQMGSFRKYQDADRLKARLALIGIEAEIQKVSINNRDTYHRVRSGPYHSRTQLNTVRRLVKENSITSLVIKLKK